MENKVVIPREKEKVKDFRDKEILNKFCEKWKSLNFYLYGEEGVNFKLDVTKMYADWGGKFFYIRTEFGTLTFRQMPGLCGIAVVHGNLHTLFTEQISDFIDELLMGMGYTLIMISDATEIKSYPSNEYTKRENKATKFGYKPYFEFVNRRTENGITMYYKYLTWK